jgi:hypothetical protein
LQTCSSKKKAPRNPPKIINVTEQVANLLQQKKAPRNPPKIINVTEQVANLLQQKNHKRYGAGCKPAPAKIPNPCSY